ncbi:helix-turn-helix domain-containing protein [Paraflavisolibacter sp. H34]|uniref:helix-turn-helix domain-containing protein n=1 Tax=Huijunlia imazamoxiresistens TaxID=3127457 RepID=UPI00301A2AE7
MAKEFRFLQFIGHPVIEVGQHAVSPIKSLLTRMHGEYDLRTDRFDVIGRYLLALLKEVQRFQDPSVRQTGNTAFRLTQQYKQALMQFVYEKQKISQYADLLAVTVDHLNKFVKAITGKSACALLDEMILLESKALLAQTTLPIGEIAQKVGRNITAISSASLKLKVA